MIFGADQTGISNRRYRTNVMVIFFILAPTLRTCDVPPAGGPAAPQAACQPRPFAAAAG